MSIKEFIVPISIEEPYPTINAKIEKESGKFLYSIILYILEKDVEKNLCVIDNFHEKGHHMHYYNKDGEKGKSIPFDYESIGKTIDFLILNWNKIIEKIENERT